MTFTDPDYIKRQIIDLPAIYWTILESENSKQMIAENRKVIDPVDAADAFFDALDHCQSGRVFVRLSVRSSEEIKESKDNYGGIYKYNVRVGSSSRESTRDHQPASLNGVVPMHLYLDAMNRISELKFELYTANREIKDLASDNTNEWSPMIKELLMQPQVQAKIGSFFAAPVSPANIGKSTDDWQKWNDADKINTALTGLKSVDPDLANTLMLLCGAVQKQPALLNLFKENLSTYA